VTFVKNVWYIAAHTYEFEQGMVARTICNEQVVMFRLTSGAIAALEDRCPHRFVPLSMGKRIGDTIQCGYHGLRFDSTGACSEAPNDGEEHRARICVRSFVAVERHAVIWLWFGAPEAADPALIPAFDFLTDPAYAVSRGHSHIQANYQMLADNLLDLSHVHYLHPSVHAGSDFADFTNKVKIEGDTVWSMLWRHHYHVSDQSRAVMGLQGSDVEGQGHSRWNAPSVLLVDTAYWDHGKGIEEDGAVRVPSAHLLTPETEYSTHYFWASGRNFLIENDEMTLATATSNKRIFETEDGPMAEAQQRAMGESTDFLAHSPVILHADAAGLAARRIIKRKLRQEASAGAGAEPESVL
jgi:phenylpropionate dioxygenase-like ring-hydroxylating dioxygenase large terminal subunit